MMKDRKYGLGYKRAILVNWWLPILLFMALGCNSAGNEQSEASVEMNPTVAFEDSTMDSSFSQEDLAQQKLQDYLDLIVLQNEHPAFESDIKEQLRNLTANGTPLLASDQAVVYENIRLKSAKGTSEDSIQKVAFYIDVLSEGSRRTDSITAILTKHRIDIDGEEFISTKVRFEEN